MQYLLFVTDSTGDANYAYGLKIEDTYAYKLEMSLRPDVYVKSFVITGNTITAGNNQVSTWFDLLGNLKIDTAIVQLGIVDCAIRVVPIFIYHLIPYIPLIHNIIYKFIHQNRPFLQKIGLKFHFTSIRTYKKRLNELIGRLQERCSNVIVIGIAPGRKDVYEHSPGLAQSIKTYNDCISEITTSKHAYFIDLAFMEDNPEKYLTPELHLLKDGHEYIFNKILYLIKNGEHPLTIPTNTEGTIK